MMSEDFIYDSPISIKYKQTNPVEDELSKNIMGIAYTWDVNIDKEKLIQILKQDKQRYIDAYRRGYWDGVMEGRRDVIEDIHKHVSDINVFEEVKSDAK